VFCIYCGKQLPNEAKFCSRCGTQCYKENYPVKKLKVLSESNSIWVCEKCDSKNGSDSLPCKFCDSSQLKLGKQSENQINEVNDIEAHEKVKFGNGAKVWFSLGLIGGGITALFFFFWSPDPYARYGSYGWIMNESFRHLSQGERMFNALLGLAGCISYGLLLEQRSRKVVYFVVGLALLGLLVNISRGEDIFITILGYGISLTVFYFILRKYWPYMK
jgi:ribosomal protein L40E